MALFKPEVKSSNNFYGICEIAPLGFTNKSGTFDWADIYIEIEVKQKGSDYTKSLKIAGSLDKDTNGDVIGGSVLKRMYHAFEQFGCDAGINIKGAFETQTGEAINDIAEHLTQFAQVEIPDTELRYDYIAYVYKEKPKQAGDKVYTRVHPRIYKNTPENKTKLKEEIDWMKSKGYVKEATNDDINAVPKNGNVALNDAGLGAL
tara:strand:+ start:7185 stop:7796 length:612 start_codon:yes stop_codon:yes gene_type:complete